METKLTAKLRWAMSQWFWVPPWRLPLSEPREIHLEEPVKTTVQKREGRRWDVLKASTRVKEIQELHHRGSQVHRDSGGPHQRKAVLPFRSKGYKVERRSKKRKG